MPNWPAVLYGIVYGLLIVAAVIVDLWLDATGRETISEQVWRRPWLGVAIVAWLAAGVVGLAGHFFLDWWRY